MPLSSAPDIRVIGADWTFYGVIDRYTSLAITRRWSSPGEFELVLPANIGDAELIQRFRLIYLPDFCGIIEHLEYSADDGGELLTVRGAALAGILANRIVVPPSGSSHTELSGEPGYIMAQLVALNAVSARNIPQLRIGDTAGIDESTSWSSRYATLSDDLTKLADEYGLGWDVVCDVAAQKWLFEVYSGRDLTVYQSANAPVIFSPEYDNVQAQTYTYSAIGAYNVALVAGQGEGAERAVTWADTASQSGFMRREVFIDARDVADPTELSRRGLAKLASEYAPTQSFEGEVVPYGTFEYGIHWRLGDVVTIRHTRWGVSMDARVTEVCEVYEAGNMRIDVTFGAGRLTLTGALNRKTNQMDNEMRR